MEAGAADFANGIKWWYGLSEAKYDDVSKKCRDMAMKTTSYGACVEGIVKEYKELKEEM